MSDEETRKAAYDYVAKRIVVDHDVQVENPELTSAIMDIRDALLAAAGVPPTEDTQVPF